MKKIILNTEPKTGPTIMVFAEGTILKPKSWLSLYNHNTYIPIGNAVNIIESWQQQGANIIYIIHLSAKGTDGVMKHFSKHRPFVFVCDILLL